MSEDDKQVDEIIAQEVDEPAPLKPPDQRGFEMAKKYRKLRLHWGCRDPSHDKILLFLDHNQAQLHANETGHKIEYLQVELD